MKMRWLFSAIIALGMRTAVAAMPQVELPNVPLHRLSCPSSADGNWVATTSVQSNDDDGAIVYQAGYRPATGGGSLKRRQAGRRTEFEWDAGALLNARTSARKLWTAGGEGGRHHGIPLEWASLDAQQRLVLNRSAADGSEDGLGPERLAYLRGMRSGETNLFPARERLLAAIVHGVPVFVGRSYAAAADRRSIVYVGASDGMLHAFDAKTGDETFAYLPRAVFDRLPSLVHAGYVQGLPVDGGIAVEDVRIGGRWRSVLAAGMGRGAQGVFALDITTPDRFGSGDVLWEFTEADDADIGNVIGTPIIAKFRTGLVRGVPQYRYFAVVPGGVNGHIADGDGRFDPSGKAALFLLALDKPATEPWQAGVNYFKFVLPASDAGRANGIVEAALVTASDGSASVAYAGDLLGNLWRFDFDGNVSNARSPKLLFVARDADGKRQPVTQRPRIVFAPERGYLVLFGTGKYLERRDLDRGAYASQSFYAIWDRDGVRISGRDALVERIARAQGSDGRYAVEGEVLAYVPAGKRGWYLDFPQAALTGERSVAAAAVFDTQIMFDTLIPASAACAAPLGRSYRLDALTGLPVSAHFDAVLPEASFLGIPPPFLAMPIETRERDATGKRRVVTRWKKAEAGQAEPDADAPPDETVVETVTTAGRLGWREIIDWQEWRGDMRDR